MRSYEANDLWALVVAAGASPNLRHRWASVGAIAFASLRADWSAQGMRVDTQTLGALLNGAVNQFPVLAWNEDFIAADPRLDVRIRVGRAVRRLFPGCIERPVADIDRAAISARALDDLIRDRHGFGIQDVVEVITDHVDFALTTLAAAWPPPTAESDDEPTGILEAAELDAARALLRAGDSTTDANKAYKLALDWLTCDVGSLSFDPGHPQSAFGRCARVRRGTATRWLPLAFLPEVLSFAVGELAGSVADLPEARLRFAQESAAAARNYLWRFAPSVLGPNDLEDGPAVSPKNVVQWIAPVDENLVLAVQMLSEPSTRFRLHPEPIVKEIADKSPSSEPIAIPFVVRGVGVPPGTEVVPLLVTSGAHHITKSPGGPGLASMSLDDLRWIASTATDSLDLAFFCKELADPAGPELLGFEVIDQWEPWRTGGKTFFRGGAQPNVITFAPHGGEAEWERAATLSEVEIAISKLGLPVSHDNALVERVGSEAPTVVSWRRPQATGQPGIRETVREVDIWILHAGRFPLAVTLSDAWPKKYRKLALDLAGAVPFGVAQVETDWNAAHSSSTANAHVLELTPATSSSLRDLFTIAVAETDSFGIQRASMAVAISALELFDGPEADAIIRDQLADVISELLDAAGSSGPDCTTVSDAWRAAPPTLTFRVIDAMAQRNALRRPIDFNEALTADVDRIIASAVKENGVAPGTYTGAAAKALDRDILSRAALDALVGKLASFTCDDVVKYGMQQLERTSAMREQTLRAIRQSEQSLTLSWDPVTIANQIQSEALRLRRANEALVETALRESPSGSAHPGEISWASLLAAANAYIEATTRSEGVHLQVSPTALEISDLYEIRTIRNEAPVEPHDGAPYLLDHHELSLATAREQFISETAPARANPREADLSTAMRASFGMSTLDLYTVFGGLIAWPMDGQKDDVVVVTREEAVQQILRVTLLGSEADARSRIEAAIALLTSTASALREGNWQPWRARQRKRRLLVQPIPELQDGSLVIAPHYLRSSLEVYRRYLSQGLLPWTQPQAPRILERALEQYRDAKNGSLENDVAQVLKEHGWAVMQNIKESKASRLNIETLSTEIDAISGKVGKRTLLLVEAKDPASVHALSQMRDQLDDFYLDRRNKPAYATQLGRKLDDLVTHEAGIAAALKLPAEVDYTIRPVFVTRFPIPAAYVGGPFEFLTLQELRTSLDADLFD